MSICTSFLNVNHQLKVISKLKSSQNLPFSEVLSKEDLSRHIKTMNYRERIFSPEVTLWAFLSQAIEDDKSQQAAVGRIVAAAVARGERPPSANTSAYSQARSRLSEESLAALTRETAHQIESSAPSEWLWKNKRIKLVDGSRCVWCFSYTPHPKTRLSTRQAFRQKGPHRWLEKTKETSVDGAS